MSLPSRSASEQKRCGKLIFLEWKFWNLVEMIGERCRICENNEYLVIILGKSRTGKSTMINALLETKLKEDCEGRIVKAEKSSVGPTISNGLAYTKVTEAYRLTDLITLLEADNFFKYEIDKRIKICKALILDAYQRKTKKVMFVYLSEFDDYYNLWRFSEDMTLINQICEDMDLPVLFLANKCREHFAYRVKFSNENEKTQIDQIEENLHCKFLEMREYYMKEIEAKFFKDAKIHDETEMIKILEKAKNATGADKEGVEKGLNQLKLLVLLKKALDEKRFIYYDPVNRYSVERLRSMMNNISYYVDPDRVSFGCCSVESKCFLSFASEIANKLYWLVQAMKGRKQIPNILKETMHLCEYFALSAKELVAEMNTTEKENIDMEEKTREDWHQKKARIVEYKNFCEECDKQWESYEEKVEQLYQFAKSYVPEKCIDLVRKENAIKASLSIFSFSMFLSSSATPSALGASASRQAETTSSLSRGEAKAEGKQPDSSSLVQPDENKKTLARFIVAMEEMEAVPQQQTNFELKKDGEYDAKLVSEAVDTIDNIWKKVIECKGHLEKFEECSICLEDFS
ncbi:uncharacterized protein MONOS_12545 [Monocercomonoides exilis]|uniref:uncharacterized protein n=1 Tax=Monocercomonoides exilis TaxID=2049356 RepID=UPI003559BD5F|nr:hypothetical protein MONOS_12545 [Monocercomonoides exilis]|eukprot:MONOS_12545.1-p1 / transcript=MONOS_12545.1 / gene=MONOS_12545 / organism=Monocercomonoides_exilis_PA203 / gene_product=unspecified product / transcript_product=unspecified product / location=Mono_scaffold00700:23099-24820(-) / protein_length=574 / sequence_SO=supercontig / SO=protein_coding / is_pseudo=false